MNPAEADIAAGVRAGDVLVGKYRVERVLGIGGMGVVVAAHHLQLDERVALKFLLPDALANPEAVARFEREARAAAKIKSEHVARVTDVGALDNGSPYMVMEYLEGSDLAAWLSSHGALPVEQAVDFVLQACEALAEAHVQGIVHRDLKPANLFCIQRSDGPLSIKVLDFGISKITTSEAPGHHLTRTRALMGSPLYMSPEQMQASKTVDARSDVWSLGVILFELLTAKPPFDAEAVTELAIKVATEAAPSLLSLRSDAPPGLDSLLRTCLAKDRRERFQTVGELALALREFAPGYAHVSVERVVGTLRRSGANGPRSSFASIEPQDPRPSLAASAPPAIPSDALSVARTAAMTSSSWQSASLQSRGGRALAVAGGGLGGLAVLGLILWKVAATPAVVHKPGAAIVESADLGVRSAAVSTEPAVPDPATVASAVPTPAPPPTLAVTPAPPSTAREPRAGARGAGPTGAHATGGAAAPTSRPTVVQPVSAANCDPPYFFDAKGTRVFKKECL